MKSIIFIITLLVSFNALSQENLGITATEVVTQGKQIGNTVWREGSVQNVTMFFYKGVVFTCASSYKYSKLRCFELEDMGTSKDF
tara:strand:+ start:346 stop:600 length:255 start_codon:yes stop_codon:yes gene_type:complete